MRALALVLALVGPAAAEPVTLAFPTLLGEYRLTLDPARLDADEARRLARLSPHLAGWTPWAVSPRLERCVVGDPDYLACGTRDTEAPHFLWNARVNLARGAAMLAELRALAHPPELAPVVAWHLRSLAFSLWLEETRLDYYRSWDPEVLARRYEDLDPARVCAPALEALRRAASRPARVEGAALGWHNCVNEAYRARLGPYPLAAWEAFLAAHGVREEIVETTPAARH